MDKNIIVEIEDGIILGIYCPDETYTVNVLDHSDRENDCPTILEYYEDLEKTKENLKNMY
tara:strand:- start:103 stop:282 length:180 start_codon:yes stop_codon:yes gene_type:complete